MSTSRDLRNEQAVGDLGNLLAGATANRGGVAGALPGQPSGGAETAPAVREEPGAVRAQRLVQLEQTIEQSVVSFRRAQARHYREVGPALEEIRHDELYLEEGYASWLDYLARRWEYSESHAYRFIDMGRVCRALAPLGDKALEALSAESHARELLPALNRHGEDAARRVWTKVLAEPGRKVTAARVAGTRDALGFGKADESDQGDDDESREAAAHAAAERVNAELDALAGALERLSQRLDKLLAEETAPLDQGQALHDVGRIRKAGRRFNKVTAVPGPKQTESPGGSDAEIIDAEVVEDEGSDQGAGH